MVRLRFYGLAPKTETAGTVMQHKNATYVALLVQLHTGGQRLKFHCGIFKELSWECQPVLRCYMRGTLRGTLVKSSGGTYR